MLKHILILKVIVFIAFTQTSIGQYNKSIPYHTFKIDSITAISMARDSGLTTSLNPIRAGLLECSDSTYSWRIVTTTWKDSLNATGRMFWINANTGKIIENGNWEIHGDRSMRIDNK